MLGDPLNPLAHKELHVLLVALPKQSQAAPFSGCVGRELLLHSVGAGGAKHVLLSTQVAPKSHT
jgi:hypothetical protein